jgi:hypothetical protein
MTKIVGTSADSPQAGPQFQMIQTTSNPRQEKRLTKFQEIKR